MPEVAQETLIAFGAAVPTARAHLGWSLDGPGSQIDPQLSHGWLSRIQNGKRQISPRTVGKLVKALDLDPVWVGRFLNSEDEPTERNARAEQLLAAAGGEGETGVAKGLMIALADAYAKGATTALDSAYGGLRKALETARDMATCAGRGTAVERNGCGRRCDHAGIGADEGGNCRAAGKEAEASHNIGQATKFLAHLETLD